MGWFLVSAITIIGGYIGGWSALLLIVPLVDIPYIAYKAYKVPVQDVRPMTQKEMDEIWGPGNPTYECSCHMREKI